MSPDTHINTSARPRTPISGTRKPTTNGHATAPTPHEKFSKLTAAVTFREGNCVARRFVAGFANPYPNPYTATATAVTVQGPSPKKENPIAKHRNDRASNFAKPNRGSRYPVSIVPARLPVNCDAKRDPACASVMDH